jgi:hypothetical protein
MGINSVGGIICVFPSKSLSVNEFFGSAYGISKNLPECHNG